MCEFLLESADWDLDNEKEKMSSWDFVSNGLVNTQLIKVLFDLKFVPLIGFINIYINNFIKLLLILYFLIL